MARSKFGIVGAFAGLALSGTAAAAQIERAIPIGKRIEWKPDVAKDELRYRAGNMRIRIVRAREGDSDYPMYGPDVTVDSPGRAPVRIEGDRSGLTFPARLTVGRWNRAGDLYLLLETYTGGAHCCDHVQVAIPMSGAYRAVDFGAFDGDRLDRLPSDLDGDGTVDFTFRDDRFLYAFASYADSWSPPLILNLAQGGPVDVSARPGYRPVFARAATRLAKACLSPGEGEWRGACPAYLAVEARLGRFDAAWDRFVKAYGEERPAEGWPLTHCTAEYDSDGQCPAGAEIVYERYSDAVRAFLVRNDYIRR